MKVSRRELACAALATMGAAVSGPAHTTAQPVPASAEAELQAAKLQVLANAQALAQYDIPMATEPAFVFQA
jgi:hypothetical protein